jgi:DNA-binding MarR family transcriptional regulator
MSDSPGPQAPAEPAASPADPALREPLPASRHRRLPRHAEAGHPPSSADRTALLAECADLALTLARTLQTAVDADPEVHRLTAAESSALRHIDRHGPIRPSALARALHVLPSNLTPTVRHLRALGLVASAPDPADRRACLLTATDAAQQNLARLRQVWTTTLQGVARGATADRADASARPVRTSGGSRREGPGDERSGNADDVPLTDAQLAALLDALSVLAGEGVASLAQPPHSRRS